MGDCPATLLPGVRPCAGRGRSTPAAAQFGRSREDEDWPCGPGQGSNRIKTRKRRAHDRNENQRPRPGTEHPVHRPYGGNHHITGGNASRLARSVELIVAFPFQNGPRVLTGGMEVGADALAGLTVQATMAASSVACTTERIGSPSFGWRWSTILKTR